MDKGLVALAAGIFVAGFGGAFAVTSLSKPNPPSAPGTITLATVGPMQPTLQPTFHKVDPSSLKPGEAEHDADTAAAAQAKVGVQVLGLDVPDSTIEAAQDDAPRAPGYVAFAMRDKVLAYMEEDGAQGVPRDAKVACLAIRDPGGKRTEHLVVKYSDTYWGGDDGATLAEWVISGCAQTVQAGASTLSLVQTDTRLLGLMPNTPEYAAQRRRWQAQVSASQSSGHAG